jgi:hypothetical protein
LKALGVIDVILDISKLETGSIELRRERGPVSAVLQQLREAALPLAMAMANNTTVIVNESRLCRARAALAAATAPGLG